MPINKTKIAMIFDVVLLAAEGYVRVQGASSNNFPTHVGLAFIIWGVITADYATFKAEQEGFYNVEQHFIDSGQNVTRIWTDQQYFTGVLLSVIMMESLLITAVISLLTIIIATPAMAVANIVGHSIGLALVLASAIAWFAIWYKGSMPAIGFVTLVALPIVGSFIYIAFRFKKYVTEKREKKAHSAYWGRLMIWSPVILLLVAVAIVCGGLASAEMFQRDHLLTYRLFNIYSLVFYALCAITAVIGFGAATQPDKAFMVSYLSLGTIISVADLIYGILWWALWKQRSSHIPVISVISFVAFPLLILALGMGFYYYSRMDTDDFTPAIKEPTKSCIKAGNILTIIFFSFMGIGLMAGGLITAQLVESSANFIAVSVLTTILACLIFCTTVLAIISLTRQNKTLFTILFWLVMIVGAYVVVYAILIVFFWATTSFPGITIACILALPLFPWMAVSAYQAAKNCDDEEKEPTTKEIETSRRLVLVSAIVLFVIIAALFITGMVLAKSIPAQFTALNIATIVLGIIGVGATVIGVIGFIRKRAKIANFYFYMCCVTVLAAIAYGCVWWALDSANASKRKVSGIGIASIVVAPLLMWPAYSGFRYRGLLLGGPKDVEDGKKGKKSGKDKKSKSSSHHDSHDQANLIPDTEKDVPMTETKKSPKNTRKTPTVERKEEKKESANESKKSDYQKHEESSKGSTKTESSQETTSPHK